MRTLPITSLLVTGVALSLSACGDDSTDPNQDIITQEQATVVGRSVGAELSNVPFSFTAFDLQSGIFGAPPFAHETARVWQASPLTGPCPAIDDATDTDGDGVPDDATLTFIVADCTTIGLKRSGTIHIVDPSTTSLGYNATITDFKLLFSMGGPDSTLIEFDGTHNVLATSTTATLSENVVLTGSSLYNGQSINGTLTVDWQVVFTVAPGGATVEMGQPLPNGTLSFDGTLEHNINELHYTLDITTPTPLVYNVTCSVTGIPYTAGRVQAHIQGASNDVFIRITFVGCGQEPTIQLFT